jgi:hypothetical protein
MVTGLRGTMRPIAFAIVTAGALLTHAYRAAVSGIAYQASVEFFLLWLIAIGSFALLVWFAFNGRDLRS